MCGRADVGNFLDEMSPEDFNQHLAAMEAEPWGEERADRRTAWLCWWLFRLLGSSEENPEARDFLVHLKEFISNEEEEVQFISPDEQAARTKGRL